MATPDADPVATGPGATAGVDHKTTDATIEGLPLRVTPDETLRQNIELWPVATKDCAPKTET